jgi:hypothetical protein
VGKGHLALMSRIASKQASSNNWAVSANGVFSLKCALPLMTEEEVRKMLNVKKEQQLTHNRTHLRMQVHYLLSLCVHVYGWFECGKWARIAIVLRAKEKEKERDISLSFRSFHRPIEKQCRVDKLSTSEKSPRNPQSH